jgi:hypothetical protein
VKKGSLILPSRLEKGAMYRTKLKQPIKLYQEALNLLTSTRHVVQLLVGILYEVVLPFPLRVREV